MKRIWSKIRKQKNTINLEEIYYINNENKELNEIIEKDTFNRIIAKLNEKEQEIVSLKILSELSFKEISQILNIPIGTVQWKYYKALHTLKTLIGSLSMYIVAIISFIVHKNQNKIIKEKVKEETKVENNQEKTGDETTKKGESSETLKDTVEDIIINTEEQVTTEQEVNRKFSEIDIGIISIASIFFIITIIFLIFFIKDQQKLKKKVSK